MLRGFASGLLFCCLVLSVAATDNEFSHCSCDEEGFLSTQTILECQRVSDILIAVAYFSIPIELLYFISCSDVPFKWVLVQFIAFIVLCGLTHLLNAWTYYNPPLFHLLLSLTIAKFLTALVSCATAITLLTLIPLLLKVKVRELFLRKNVLELDQEVGMMKRQKEASWHVRMLTREIRKSLDMHTILYTTLVELSKTLELHNCAVWMPNESGTEMKLTHELKRNFSEDHMHSMPFDDPDVLEIKGSKGVRILRPDSALGIASNGGTSESGAIAAIRMPMLQVSNFKWGTPEVMDTRYAILVLVLPNFGSRGWSHHEIEIVEVVADQVAVALSHAAVLEESQLMRDKLGKQNRALQRAKENAMLTSQARNSFQKVMSHGMRRPLHSVLGLLSMLQEEIPNVEQRIIVDTMLKTGNVLSALINHAVEISENDDSRMGLEMKPFQLHNMIREVSCFTKCLCLYKRLDFEFDVQNSLPNKVIGDEKRAFQIILHMVGNLLNTDDEGGRIIFRVLLEKSGEWKDDRALWRSGVTEVNVPVKFEITRSGVSNLDGLVSGTHCTGWRKESDETKGDLSFSLCKKLVKMMQGDVQVSSDSSGSARNKTLILKFQIQPSAGRASFPLGTLSEQPNSIPHFRGVQVILVDDDDVNRMVTKKLLEKLGCQVTAVSSGFECLGVLSNVDNRFVIVLLDLHMPEMDGFEVATRIRKFRSSSWPLIIAFTGSAEECVWERCLQLGMNGVIRKPVLLQAMADELKRVLQCAGEGL